MYKDILITGITNLNEYPKQRCTKYCKQCLDTDSFFIPCQKPDIESINELKVKICINETEIINTVLGPKIIICGEKSFKIIYTANNTEQSVHSAHWSIPFCSFILLEDICFCECADKVGKEVFAGVEYACVTEFDLRRVGICLIYILCPSIKSSCTNFEYPCFNQFSSTCGRKY